MNECNNVLTLDPPTDRERAVIEAGRLIDALTSGNGDLVKDCWYQLNKFVRGAIAEIRQTEPTRPHWTDKRKAKDCAGGEQNERNVSNA